MRGARPVPPAGRRLVDGRADEQGVDAKRLADGSLVAQTDWEGAGSLGSGQPVQQLRPAVFPKDAPTGAEYESAQPLPR